jgi:predicted anti-sigma-YlaC factor YlaD
MPLTPSERSAMTAAVLARTTGSACQRALLLAGGEPEEPFDVQTAALVSGHLEHCPECRAVAQTLAETRAALAGLVEIEPGAEFTAQVLAATSGRRAPSRRVRWVGLSGRWAWAGTIRERAASAWERVLARPRLSLELAYLATVLLVIVIGNPAVVADALATRTSRLVAREAVSASAGVRQLGTATSGVGSVMPTMVERAMRVLESKQTSAAKGWTWFVERTSQLVSASWDWFRGLFGWVAFQAAPPAPTEPAKPPVRVSQ